MCKIEVVNKRKREAGVYIGRPSPLGNPFVLGRDGDREAVVEQYEIWLDNKLQDPTSPQAIEFRRLAKLATKNGSLRLQCWCAPLRCHGDVIKSRLEEVI